ncbi:MAG: hypothetical protein ABI782_03275 [Anaerolineaceae bacterium]
MQHKALIATLLLPLPFAALPLVGVLLGMTGGSPAVIVDAQQVEQLQSQFNLTNTQANPLAYGISDPSHAGCDVPSELRSES